MKNLVNLIMFLGLSMYFNLWSAACKVSIRHSSKVVFNIPGLVSPDGGNNEFFLKLVPTIELGKTSVMSTPVS